MILKMKTDDLHSQINMDRAIASRTPGLKLLVHESFKEAFSYEYMRPSRRPKATNTRGLEERHSCTHSMSCVCVCVCVRACVCVCASVVQDVGTGYRVLYTVFDLPPVSCVCARARQLPKTATGNVSSLRFCTTVFYYWLVLY